MKLEELMSGIAVVIDDKFVSTAAGESSEDKNGDSITNIVMQLEQKWHLPFYAVKEMPLDKTWPNLLRAASFILLDWQLWPSGASRLEQDGVRKHIQFLELARDYFVPVFIFTNENPEDIADQLPPSIYPETPSEQSFIFIKRKADLLSGNTLDFAHIENWIKRNASVYALKAWEQAFYAAKRELFGRMHEKSPDWPKIFWKAYVDDSVDPSSSLMNFINDNLRGRMRTNVFDPEILHTTSDMGVPQKDLLELIEETSCQPANTLPQDETRCGDLFMNENKFFLNLLPDCDCIPRSTSSVDTVELHCIEGKKISKQKLAEKYHEGHFNEAVWENIAFSMHNGESVRFDFRKLRIKKFSELKDQRIGRLLHPYLTRIQQRYALYVQRQGLPRIPREAILLPPTKD